MTDGSGFVWGTISTKSKYVTESEGLLLPAMKTPQDKDNMTLEACVDASTHATCHPFTGNVP